MTKNETCIGSAFHKPLIDSKKNQERLLEYKRFALAFSYPDDNFFKVFPQLASEKENLLREYDRLFRAGIVWLYSCEYTAEHEFQRSNSLSDITGFYRAFGVETNKDRPDSFAMELEFMYYLIFKALYAEKNKPSDMDEKIFVCEDAQKKFFAEHLYPAAKKIAEAVSLKASHNFYKEMSGYLAEFMEAEARILL